MGSTATDRTTGTGLAARAAYTADQSLSDQVNGTAE